MAVLIIVAVFINGGRIDNWWLYWYFVAVLIMRLYWNLGCIGIWAVLDFGLYCNLCCIVIVAVFEWWLHYNCGRVIMVAVLQLWLCCDCIIIAAVL